MMSSSAAAASAAAVPSSSSPLLRLVHRRQLYDWDCGIACVYSILVHLGEPHLLYHPLIRMMSTKLAERVWSLDLAWFCYAYSIPTTFHTQRIGVDQKHREKRFYQEFKTDERRIENMFRETVKQGLKIQQGYVRPPITQCYPDHVHQCGMIRPCVNP